jgi:hypothetical protein
MSHNPPTRRVSTNGQVTIGLRYAGKIVRIEPTDDGVMVRFAEPGPTKANEEQPESIADHLEAAFELMTRDQLKREMILHGCAQQEIEDVLGLDSDWE